MKITNNYLVLTLIFLAVVVFTSYSVYYLTSKDTISSERVNYGERFQITYVENILGNVKENLEQNIEEAVEFWRSILHREEKMIPLKFYYVEVSPYTLARGGMNSVSDIREGGFIQINTNARPNSWTDVIKHEIGHVLGIGLASVWRSAIVYQNSKKILDREIFPEVYDYYTSIVEDPNESGVPLGANGGHFSEPIFGRELMTPYSNEGYHQPATLLTLHALKKIGWNIDLEKAESF